MLLDHKAQEAVVWSVSWGGEDGTWQLKFNQQEQTPTITNFTQAVVSIIKCFHVTLFFLYLGGGSRGRSAPTQPQLHLHRELILSRMDEPKPDPAFLSGKSICLKTIQLRPPLHPVSSAQRHWLPKEMPSSRLHQLAAGNLKGAGLSPRSPTGSADPARSPPTPAVLTVQ